MINSRRLQNQKQYIYWAFRRFILLNLMWTPLLAYAGDEQQGESQQGGWTISSANLQYRQTQPFHQLCLQKGSGFFASYELVSDPYPSRNCEAVFVLIKPHDKELILDTSRTSLTGSIALEKAKEAGLESILNGKIPELIKQYDDEQVALAARQAYVQYRQQYSEAETPEKIDEFIRKYLVNDPDSLVPQLRTKAIELKKQMAIQAVQIQKNVEKYAEQEKAEASKKEAERKLVIYGVIVGIFLFLATFGVTWKLSALFLSVSDYVTKSPIEILKARVGTAFVMSSWVAYGAFWLVTKLFK